MMDAKTAEAFRTFAQLMSANGHADSALAVLKQAGMECGGLWDLLALNKKGMSGSGSLIVVAVHSGIWYRLSCVKLTVELSDFYLHTAKECARTAVENEYRAARVYRVHSAHAVKRFTQLVNEI